MKTLIYLCDLLSIVSFGLSFILDDVSASLITFTMAFVLAYLGFVIEEYHNNKQI